MCHNHLTHSPLLLKIGAFFIAVIDPRSFDGFSGIVDALDQSVGEVLETLYEADMLDNTIIVLSTDNGGLPFGDQSNRGYNFPLRGAKGTLWEGGTRGSAFIWSPLLNQNRRVSDQMLHITDWLPTLYSAAGMRYLYGYMFSKNTDERPNVNVKPFYRNEKKMKP